MAEGGDGSLNDAGGNEMIEQNATKAIRNKPFKKLRYREKMLNFLSDPENDIPSRTTIACDVLKMKYSTHLYRYFSCAELNEILDEALGVRRKRYAADLARVDRGLLDRAISGDPAAAKLVYQRFENWEPSERKRVDVSGEVRAQVFREILDEISQVSQGFADVFPEDGVDDAGNEPCTRGGHSNNLP